MVNAQKRIFPGHTHPEREEHSRAEQSKHTVKRSCIAYTEKGECQVTLKSLSGIPVHTFIYLDVCFSIHGLSIGYDYQA